MGGVTGRRLAGDEGSVVSLLRISLRVVPPLRISLRGAKVSLTVVDGHGVESERSVPATRSLTGPHEVLQALCPRSRVSTRHLGTAEAGTGFVAALRVGHSPGADRYSIAGAESSLPSPHDEPVHREDRDPVRHSR